MFEDLSETIKHDDAAETTTKERVIKGLVITVLSVALFGGLYFAVRMLE